MARKKDIEQSLARINGRNVGVFTLDHNHAGYRLENAAGRLLSPRCGAGDMLLWLDGFLEGINTTMNQKGQKSETKNSAES